MATPHDLYGVVRVYETSRSNEGAVALRLKDRFVELGEREFAGYVKLVEWLPSGRPQTDIETELAMTPERFASFLAVLERSGLLYRTAQIPERLSGEEFHRDYFSKFLPSWLDEAFSHPFWDRMMSGEESEARCFAT